LFAAALPSTTTSLEVNFEGRDIHLRDHHIIITMNPTYAGRTELPDNLKTHFRPCNMMIPDYSLISEIIMYAEGFGHSTELSKKLTTLYKMAGEMLSQQPHYDFGMRAVKSVLIMAGNLKREDPDAHEDELLISAMDRANVPKLLKVDRPIYNALVADVFPATDLTAPRQDDVAHCIRKVLIENKLEFTSTLAEKATQLNETLNVRFGVALVGEAGSGKTTLHKMLANTLSHLYHDYLGTDKYGEGQGPQPVVCHRINPKSISVGELYGSFNLSTQEWKDGIAAHHIRLSANPIEEVRVEENRRIATSTPYTS
jgi:dynein heavy chain